MQCHFPFERTTGETVKTSVLPAREYTVWGLGRGGTGTIFPRELGLIRTENCPGPY